MLLIRKYVFHLLNFEYIRHFYSFQFTGFKYYTLNVAVMMLCYRLRTIHQAEQYIAAGLQRVQHCHLRWTLTPWKPDEL